MSNKTAEKLLDARELEAPLPLEYAIKILSLLQNGEYLKMIHRMKPCKLDAILNANGFWHTYFEEDNGNHYVYAAKISDNDTIKLISEMIKNEYGRIIAI